jgi:high-affinity iron transporter
MFLDAVILILQEILEAALLISVLLAVNLALQVNAKTKSGLPLRWYYIAILVGLLGAACYAWYMPQVSEWFDYVGQEVVNAAMQLVVIACLFAYGHMLLAKSRRAAAASTAGYLLVVIIAVGITREGSEILLYLTGIWHTSTLMPVLLGAGVAAGIGVSAGVLLYFALSTLVLVYTLRIGTLLLALFAGNMAAQAVLLLTQADWLPATVQLWDSSAWLPEYTVTGQLLYALIGYEATPSLLQGVAYVTAVALILTTPLARLGWHKH